MNRSASSATVSVPRSAVFRFAGSCPCATAPRTTLARALASSGVILPDRCDGVAPHRRTTPRASSVDNYVGLRAGRAHAHAEAAHGVIPSRELAAGGLERVHSALGDPFGCHGSL